MEKERGRRKMTERARKWREWASIMRLDSDRMPQRFRLVAPAITAPAASISSGYTTDEGGRGCRVDRKLHINGEELLDK